MDLNKIMEVTHKAQPEKKNDIAHIPFQHFAPKCDVNDEVVFSALDYALEQKDVHNIAITGTYGSGKSSVLRSYINRNNKSKFLSISLATFACEKKQSSENTEDIGNDEFTERILQKIEKSILQQIFYKKSGSKLPFSRFKRIRNLNWW